MVATYQKALQNVHLSFLPDYQPRAAAPGVSVPATLSIPPFTYEFKLEKQVLQRLQHRRADELAFEAAHLTLKESATSHSTPASPGAATQDAQAGPSRQMLKPTVADRGELGDARQINDAGRPMNYADFEHGLAPPDPWDTQKTVKDELNEIHF